MNKALVLDFKVLNELDISIEELLYIHSIYNEKDLKQSEIDLQKLEKEKYIKIITEDEKNNVILRNKSVELMKFLTIETNTSLKEEVISIKKSERVINSEINERVDEFRSKFKGLKAGSMGSAKSCKHKFIRWMKENPQYTFDNILKATDMYIDSLNGDYRFLQRADYFIFKQENNREESSRLSAHIDEIDSFSKEDWTSKLN